MGQSTILAPRYFVWVAAGVESILLSFWNLRGTEGKDDLEQKAAKGAKVRARLSLERTDPSLLTAVSVRVDPVFKLEGLSFLCYLCRLLFKVPSLHSSVQ
jgi:hypothetical protein